MPRLKIVSDHALINLKENLQQDQQCQGQKLQQLNLIPPLQYSIQLQDLTIQKGKNEEKREK